MKETGNVRWMMDGDRDKQECAGIENLRKREKAGEKYQRFMPQYKEGVQDAGQPPTDFAMICYQSSLGECQHMMKGVAKYADGSVYEGAFKDGLLDGDGVL